MPAVILDGKKLAATLRADLKARVETLRLAGKTVTLAVIMAGDDPASSIYVRNKIAACAELGIKSLSYHLEAGRQTEAEAERLIGRLNSDPDVDGLLVQLPLPAGMDEPRLLSLISPEKDADGFHSLNAGNLFLGRPAVPACTPAGIMELIASSGQPVRGKHAVVIGRSNIVGKPVAVMLLNADATVTVCHSKTPDLKSHTLTADILVAAAGRAGLVTGGMIKPGAIVVDVGMNRTPGGKLCGDVDFDSAVNVAGFITPVPGGVGPMTITMLLRNTVAAAERKAAEQRR